MLLVYVEATNNCAVKPGEWIQVIRKEKSQIPKYGTQKGWILATSDNPALISSKSRPNQFYNTGGR